MALEFPNLSRSFDEARNAIRFSGYDGMTQVPFLIEAGALPRSGKTALSEEECLTAFDAARGSIHNVARKNLFMRKAPVLHPDRRRFLIDHRSSQAAISGSGYRTQAARA